MGVNPQEGKRPFSKTFLGNTSGKMGQERTDCSALAAGTRGENDGGEDFLTSSAGVEVHSGRDSGLMAECKGAKNWRKLMDWPSVTLKRWPDAFSPSSNADRAWKKTTRCSLTIHGRKDNYPICRLSGGAIYEASLPLLPLPLPRVVVPGPLLFAGAEQAKKVERRGAN